MLVRLASDTDTDRGPSLQVGFMYHWGHNFRFEVFDPDTATEGDFKLLRDDTLPRSQAMPRINNITQFNDTSAIEISVCCHLNQTTVNHEMTEWVAVSIMKLLRP